MNDLKLYRVLQDFAANGVYYIGGSPINNIQDLLATLRRISEQPHCKACGATIKQGRPCRKCAKFAQRWERPECPLCGNTHTGRHGKKRPMIGKAYRCKDCKRQWTVGGVGMGIYERYERPIRALPVTSQRVGYGYCARCRQGNNYLLSGLCMKCSDELGDNGHLYYWRKYNKLCVKCGCLANTLFCSNCLERNRRQSRVAQRRYKEEKKRRIFAPI